MIKKCLAFFNKYQDKINKFLPIFLSTYMVLMILPYVFGRVEAINLFFSSGWSRAIFRLLTMMYAVIYLLLVGLSNRIKVKWYYLVGGAILLFILLISSIFAPKDIYKLDGTLGTTISFWEYSYSFVHFFISISLFIFIISFLVPIMPSIKVLNNPLFILIGVTTFAIILSFFLEGKELIELINGGDAHAKDARSIFQSKNSFGLFIFLSAISSAFLILVNEDNNKYSYLFILIMLFTFMATIIGCRTAFICCFSLIIYLFIRSIILLHRHSKKLFKIILIILASLALIFVLYMSVPIFHVKGMDGLYNITIYSFLRIGDAFAQRAFLWAYAGDVMKNPLFLIFGANFDNARYLLISLSHHYSDYHRAYVSWFVQTGIIGTLVYAFLFGYVSYRIYQLIRKDLEKGLLVLVIFLSSILYGIPETNTMFISTSLFTFITNILVVIYLEYSLKSLNIKNNN